MNRSEKFSDIVIRPWEYIWNTSPNDIKSLKYILKEFLKASQQNRMIDESLFSRAWHASLLTCLAFLHVCVLTYLH